MPGCGVALFLNG